MIMTKSELIDDYCAFMLNSRPYDVVLNKKTIDGLSEMLKYISIDQLSKLSPSVLNDRLKKYGVHHGNLDNDCRGFYYYIEQIIKATKDYIKDLEERKVKWECSIQDILTVTLNHERTTFGLIHELVEYDDGRYLKHKTLSDILKLLLNHDLILKKVERYRTIYELTKGGLELVQSENKIVIELALEED